MSREAGTNPFGDPNINHKETSKIKTVEDAFGERFPEAHEYSIFIKDEVIGFANYILGQYKEELIEELEKIETDPSAKDMIWRDVVIELIKQK